jgi:hypothetical protein
VPLLDHFHPPVVPPHAWGSFAVYWAVGIADALHGILPRRYFAEIRRRCAQTVQEDVTHCGYAAESDDPTAVVLAYEPPEPMAAAPAFFSDHVEVQLRDGDDDARIVAVVELVLESNKDRSEARRAFAIKCATYLQRGVGVITVDAVTTHQANMHNELVRLLELEDRFQMPSEASLAAVAYRPARRGTANEIDVWPVALAVGSTLPVLPLALLRHRAIPLDLEASYMEARQRARL